MKELMNVISPSTDKLSIRILIFSFISILLILLSTNVVKAADEITYYHNDISGTPILSTNAAGEVLWKESYRPYGDKLTKQAASKSNQIGFHGKPFDDDTGFSYMQARYYDPILGRFTGIDPVGYQEDNLHSFNRYAYANNNPYKYVDPDGNYVQLYFMALGFTLAVDSAVDGMPPQARAGKAVNVVESGFKKTALSEGVSRGMANQAKNASKVSDQTKKTYYSKSSKNKAYDRADGLCEYCGKKTQKDTPYKKDSAEGDHFIPQSQGGKTTKENLVNACRDCNGPSNKGGKMPGKEWAPPNPNARVLEMLKRY